MGCERCVQLNGDIHRRDSWFESDGMSSMVSLPILTELRVNEYELFPGDPQGSGITWSFRPGATVIAGINGIGKTTLLSMILRAFTGPFDLTGDGGSGSLSVVLPDKPVRLRPQNRRLFQRRVADGAENAKVILSATIGKTAITISRRLNNLSLDGLIFNDKPVELPDKADEREHEFQSRLTQLIGLGSFVDVLLVLHHVILFYENRPGALWDPNAQRQLLRALCLNQEDASRVVTLERELQSADSQARNVHARITSTDRRWREALQQEAEEERVLAELSAEQQILDAELLEASRLETVLQQLDEDRRDARLAYERARIAREHADGAIERFKYTGLLRLFPSLDETASLALSRIMTDGRCLVCNSPAIVKQRELERQIAQGICPVCGAEPDSRDNLVAPHEFDQARLEQERKHLAVAKREEETQLKQLHNTIDQFEQTILQLDIVRQSIQERKEKNQLLRSRLPDSVTSKEYEIELNRLRSEHSEWQDERRVHLQQLRSLFAERRDTITAKSTELVRAFAELIEILLVEKVRLVQVSAEPRYMQAPGEAGDRVQVPAYAAEMASAARPTLTRRTYPSEVSESQRELIDLAFRLALVGVFGGSCTFVMETPEASLDGVAMERVGQALATFAQRDSNRLVVTSNLTNAGLITALFDGTDLESDPASRLERVLNLLKIAAPNRALLHDRERYDKLLEEAVWGAN